MKGWVGLVGWPVADGLPTGFSFLCLLCVVVHFFWLVNVWFCCVRFSFFHTKPRDWLGETSPKWPILCRVGCQTATQISQSACLLLSCEWLGVLMLHFLSLTTVLFHDCWSTLPWSFKFDSQPLASCWEIRNWSQYFALLCIAHCSRALMSLVLILTTIVMMVMCTVECLCWTWFSQSFGFLRLLFWRSAFGNKWHRIFFTTWRYASTVIAVVVCLPVCPLPAFILSKWLTYWAGFRHGGFLPPLYTVL